MRPSHFNRKSWRELQAHFDRAARVAARLQGTVPAGKNVTLFATIAARCKQDGKSRHEVIVELVREMRATKKSRNGEAIESGTCPYCGGYYTIEMSCSGPRTADPAANTCKKMRVHRRMVNAAAEADERGLTT